MTRAANELHVSQSTMSKQLKDLEEELGQQLYYRTNYGIQLTEAGMLLRKRCEELLSIIDKTESEFRSLNFEEKGDVYIGFSEGESTEPLVSILHDFQKKHPSITIHIYTGNLVELTEWLDQGRLDFAIVFHDADPERYVILDTPYDMAYGVLVRKDDPVSEKKYITFEELKTLPLITSRHAAKKVYPKYMGGLIDELQIIADFDKPTVAAIMVREKMGYMITFANPLYTNENSELKLIMIKPKMIAKTHIIWKKYQVFSPSATKLITELKSIFREQNI